MNNRINDSNIAIGISMTNTIRPPTSLSVQNSNTYDINANIMIGIDDTIQLGGLSIPTDENYNLPPGTGTGSGRGCWVGGWGLDRVESDPARVLRGPRLHGGTPPVDPICLRLPDRTRRATRDGTD